MSIKRRTFIQNSMVTGLACGLLGQLSHAAETGSLITKAIPSTGEHLPVVGLGTNSFRSTPRGDEKQEFLEVIRIFSEHGGLIDTAPSYGNSESVLGSLISELGLESKMIYASKCDRSGGDSTMNQIAKSIEYLNTSPIDIMQIHNFRNWKNNFPVLREAKEAGLIRYTGVTVWRANQHEELLKILRSEQVDVVQLNYSILDRDVEAELLPLALEKGIAVLANVPYGRGSTFSAVKGQELPEWAKEFSSSWGQFFLKYNASHPAIVASIPGTTTPRYALDNAGAVLGRLPTAAERKMQEDYMAAL